MGVGESLVTGFFVMGVVFVILVMLWGIVALFSKVVSKMEGGSES